MSWLGEIVSNHKNVVEEEASAAAAATEEEEEEECQNKNGNGVTSHVYLKPAHTCGSLDKEMVLRQIRQRKRVHKVRAAFQALLTSPFSASSTTGQHHHAHKRWIDDAFAAP